MADEYETRLTRLLRENGVASFRFARRSKHRALHVEHKGRTVTLIFPSTPSDWRGPYNSVTTLRRLLDLPRPVRAGAASRPVRRRKVGKSRPKVPVPKSPARAGGVVTNDYVAILRDIKAAMLAANYNDAPPHIERALVRVQ